MPFTKNFIPLIKNGQNLPPLPSISDIIHLYKLSAIRQLAQNFILDMNLTRKIVKQAGNLKGSHVCEIGPGPGGITRAILENNINELAVIEKDKRFLPSLQILADSVTSETKMSIYHADILKFQMDSIFPQNVATSWSETDSNINIIGNLPFNISLPLLLRWLREMDARNDLFALGRVKMTLTFQKEIAERMIALPGSNQRSRLSVITQSLAHVDHKFTFLGKACVPQPQVDVGVVNIHPKEKPTYEMSFDIFHKVVTSIFNFRQKFCKRGVENLFPLPVKDEMTHEIFHKLPHIHPSTPIFKLENEHFNDIAHAYLEIVQRIPGLVDYDYRQPKSQQHLWAQNMF
ncbi:unnamed protein product [Gordionus sp. m RMFG-2023]|uniref:dimethyladenosine transferase 1, mitochondrial-like n=1 Tax=Gordionus sp. m RMFG-2023 TaxID=3053472 RepID=UPI0030DE410D